MMHERRKRDRRQAPAILDLTTHLERHVSVEQLAAYWSLDIQTVRKFIRVGELRGFSFGRATRIKTVDALDFELRSQIRAKAG